jgi:hypothetical protein
LCCSCSLRSSSSWQESPSSRRPVQLPFLLLLVTNSLCLVIQKDHLSNRRSCNEDYLHGIGDKNQHPENKKTRSTNFHKKRNRNDNRGR